ncbi:MAG: type II secretion system protein GspG [Candidatus Sumerlaeaceae bacterium]
MKKGFSMIELLVVILILGLLATLAVGLFSKQVEKARYAKARTTIAALELAINRYQIDVGSYPPSGTGNLSGPTSFEGSGMLELALLHSMSGNTSAPASNRWQGPYISVKEEDLGNLNGIPLREADPQPAPGEVQFLDPWKSPYRYVRCCGSSSDNYSVNNATRLPSTHPYAATEIWYNPSTFQIVSNGHNGTTFGAPNIGLEDDDVTNFGQ